MKSKSKKSILVSIERGRKTLSWFRSPLTQDLYMPDFMVEFIETVKSAVLFAMGKRYKNLTGNPAILFGTASANENGRVEHCQIDYESINKVSYAELRNQVKQQGGEVMALQVDRLQQLEREIIEKMRDYDCTAFSLYNTMKIIHE